MRLFFVYVIVKIIDVPFWDFRLIQKLLSSGRGHVLADHGPNGLFSYKYAAGTENRD